MRISDWSSDVCSSDLAAVVQAGQWIGAAELVQAPVPVVHAAHEAIAVEADGHRVDQQARHASADHRHAGHGCERESGEQAYLHARARTARTRAPLQDTDAGVAILALARGRMKGIRYQLGGYKATTQPA